MSHFNTQSTTFVAESFDAPKNAGMPMIPNAIFRYATFEEAGIQG